MVDISQVRSNPQSFQNNPELISLRQKLFERSLKIDKDITATNEQIINKDRKTSALYRALAFNSENAAIILEKNTSTALKIVSEYNHPFFEPGLLQAIKTPDIISAKLQGDEIIVDINMNRAAGSIDNYANAVKLARKALGVSGKINPIVASRFWFRNIYSPTRLGTKVTEKRKNRTTGETTTVDITAKYIGKYDEMMLARLSRFVAAKPAPWWSLLENGNAVTRMSSDIGGVGLPYNPPTHFVETSKRQIQEILKGSYRTELQKELQPFQKKLRKLELRKRQNEEDRLLVNELLAGGGKTKREAALEKIRQRLRERYADTQADYKRIEKIIDRLAAGERIEEKVAVGRNVRIRVLQILNELNLEYRDLER